MSEKINLVIFASSRDLSKEIIKKILKFKNKINIVCVVSDKKFKSDLNANKIKYFKWVENSKNFTPKVMKILSKNKKSLIGISLQYKWKIEKKIIEKFKYIFNFHYGNLPSYRGHNIIIHAILNKDRFIYGTIHKIDENLDSGFIIGKVKVTNKDLSSKNIEKKITYKFADYFEKLILNILNKKKLKFTKIKKEKKFYRQNDIQKLKLVKNFKEILVKARAFDYPPHEPAFFLINKKKIYLKLKEK